MSEQAILREIISLEMQKHQQLHELDHVRAKHVWTCGKCKRGTQAKNLTVIGVHYSCTNYNEPLAECHRLGAYTVVCPKCNQMTLISVPERQSRPGRHQFITKHKPYMKQYLDFYQKSTAVRRQLYWLDKSSLLDELSTFITESRGRDDRYQKRPMPEHQFFAEQQQFEHQKRKPQENSNGYSQR